MENNRVAQILLLILMVSSVLMPSGAVLGQHRERGDRRARRSAVVVSPPRERTRVVVGSREYFYARGVFYRSGPKGYVAIRGPVGARIKTLPVGYLSVQIGGAPFFLYYGTYYRLDPVAKEYVVVAPPAGAPTIPGLDKIDLVTGESVNGTYLGGTQSAVQVEVGGKVQEIPVDQIVSITFAPPEQ